MKIAVLISGGVDSSVALKLLKEQGHEVHAFYLKIWLEDELQHLSDCPWEEDLTYIRQICDQDNIPLEVIPMQREYFDTVVKYTIEEVKAGRTPNPDIMCNNHIKFGLAYKKIEQHYQEATGHKPDAIASGHYAQITKIDGHHHLQQAPDPIKDQTYFLSRLSQDQLSKIIFPIGHLSKEEVRQHAERFDLPNKARKDSQGICFLGKFKYNEFIKHYLGTKPGPIINADTGETIAQHEGFYFHTVGQRRGLKLSGGPWFVVRKDPEKNEVYVSNTYHETAAARDTVHLTDFNWSAGERPNITELKVKLRHGPEFHTCHFIDENTIKLHEQDQGIAAGQFAVFYTNLPESSPANDTLICLGSAVIT